MKLLVGLGNPGKKYTGTRHNVGFETLNRVARRLDAEPPRARFDSLVSECRMGDERLLLLWPQTYMNRSGQAARQAVSFYKAPLENVLVICDDFHLPLGKLRLRSGGSAGGQKGLDDILTAVGDQTVPRLRIGVGPVPERWDPADFVLAKFSTEEMDDADASVGRAADSCLFWAESGIVEAMNRYN